MSLEPGARLGTYEITGVIGAGGMGEVYRAHDSNLNRHVAIKVLPDVLAEDPDRLARFQREAEALAALNHPNIAQVYDLERSGDSPAIVMELVDGPTLADLIETGPIPFDDALPIARQVAEALEAAHARGIIHRDLKPANIKVRDDGTVKVLDFGLAKVMEIGVHGAAGDITHSPTISSPAMTERGVILGTAAYMAPEQATGKPVDKRADIWAFGVVLFEMLTGTLAFGGDGVADSIANVLTREPDWNALPAHVPPRVRWVLRACLRVAPKERLHDVADARLALEGLFDGISSDDVEGHQPGTRQPALRVALATLVAAGFVSVVVLWSVWPPAETRRVTRLAVGQAVDEQLYPRPPSFALSPDGTALVYRALIAGEATLAVRRFGTLDTTLLYDPPGLANLGHPFFSPDGSWVGVLVNDEVRKIPTAGGSALTIGAVPFQFDYELYGATWGEDDRIVLGTTKGLWRMPATGGDPEALISPDDDSDALYEWPEILPGGSAVIFSVRHPDQDGASAQIVALHLDSGEQQVLVSGGSMPKYVPTGHLVYTYRDTLRAVPFDLERLQVTGAPVTVMEGVSAAPSGAAEFSVARDGTLVYLTGGMRNQCRPAWVDQSGRDVPIETAIPAPLTSPALSPDEARLALVVNEDVWVYYFDSRPPVRLTTGIEASAIPTSLLWSPDGRQILYSDDHGLWAVPADASESTRERVSPEGVFLPIGWSPDGLELLAARMDEDGVFHIVRWPLGNADAVQPVVDGVEAALSPDGRWLAYASFQTGIQTGTRDIWVRPYPGPGAPQRVSRSNSWSPVWAKDGHELYYIERVDASYRLMAVPTHLGSSFSSEPPRVVLDIALTDLCSVVAVQLYDVASDGRFVMLKSGDPEPSRLILVQNWFEELKRLVPAR